MCSLMSGGNLLALPILPPRFASSLQTRFVRSWGIFGIKTLFGIQFKVGLILLRLTLTLTTVNINLN